MKFLRKLKDNVAFAMNLNGGISQQLVKEIKDEIQQEM